MYALHYPVLSAVLLMLRIKGSGELWLFTQRCDTVCEYKYVICDRAAIRATERWAFY